MEEIHAYHKYPDVSEKHGVPTTILRVCLPDKSIPIPRRETSVTHAVCYRSELDTLREPRLVPLNAMRNLM